MCEAEKAIISESPLKYVKPFTYGNELNLGTATIPESVRSWKMTHELGKDLKLYLNVKLCELQKLWDAGGRRILCQRACKHRCGAAGKH